MSTETYRGHYRVIGAGANADFDMKATALGYADQVNAAGWWVAVVDMNSHTLVAELGSVKDFPR